MNRAKVVFDYVSSKPIDSTNCDIVEPEPSPADFYEAAPAVSAQVDGDTTTVMTPVIR